MNIQELPACFWDQVNLCADKKWKNIYLQVTLEEVNSQIALEYGQAMTVRVLKADGEVMRKCWSGLVFRLHAF